MGIRPGVTVPAVSLPAACVPAGGQDASPAADDQQRLRREQAEQLRQRAQPISPGAQAFTIMVGSAGAGPMRRIGGPPPAQYAADRLMGGAASLGPRWTADVRRPHPPRISTAVSIIAR